MKTLQGNPRRDLEDAITSEYLNEIFSYTESTGILRNKRVQRGIQYGQEAGNNGVYSSVRIQGRVFRVHRVIWCMVYGTWPSDLIDHINGDRRDNRLSNLREATRAMNARNKKAPPNKTGHRNVSWRESKGCYRVKIMMNGKRYEWSRAKLEDAVELARAKRVELHGEYAFKKHERVDG